MELKKHVHDKETNVWWLFTALYSPVSAVITSRVTQYFCNIVSNVNAKYMSIASPKCLELYIPGG